MRNIFERKESKREKIKKKKDKNIIEPRFDKKKIMKIKKDRKEEKEENVDKLKKKIEKQQNKKFKKERKTQKNKPEEKFGDLSRRKRMKIWMLVVVLVASLFIGRIGWIQFVMGDELKQMAYE